MDRVDERFAQTGATGDIALSPRWSRPLAGDARLELLASGLRLERLSGAANRYSNAQIDDYSARRARDYLWRPPLRLSVQARASHASAPPDDRAEAGDWLRGTYGFGFWNAPMTMAAGGLRLPEAVWFFGASPPSQMALTVAGSGHGWKAQVVHAQRPGALAAAAPLALSALWARISGDTRAAAGWMERMTGAHEVALSPGLVDMRLWADYTLEWLPEQARFWVDGKLALEAPHPPRGPLGFVAWIDNQFAVATPRGDLRFGALDCGPQWLELASLNITPLG